jgi:hypothetical protein
MFHLQLLALILISVADGAHFLGGTITWHLLNESDTGSPVAIVITQTYLWTYASAPCTSNMIVNNSQIVIQFPSPSLAGTTLTCLPSCPTGGSPSFSSPLVLPRCTDASIPGTTTVGQRSDIVYVQAGANFSLAFQGGFWRNLSTGASTSWSIGSHINMQKRSDNGLYNNAPVATMMSPIYIPRNTSTTISVPIADPDGDTLRCRWATNTNGVDECGGVCPPSSLPPGTIIYPNCTIKITGPNVGNWFAVTLMVSVALLLEISFCSMPRLKVEDFINSSSTTPLSSVPVQFLVEVVAPSVCNNPPEIVGDPLDDSCTPITIGSTFTSRLIAINNCGPTVVIDDIETLSFAFVVKGNITKVNSTTYYKSLTWTPITSQLGYQVICAMALDR